MKDCVGGGDEVCKDGEDNARDDKAREVIAGYTKCDDGRTTFRPSMVCDGVHQCPGLDTIDEDPFTCHAKYVSLNITSNLADFPCVTADVHRHPNLTILAVRCNKKNECLGKVDEIGCEDISNWRLGCIIFIAALSGIFSIGLVWKRISPSVPKTNDSCPPKVEKTAIKNVSEVLLEPKPEQSSVSAIQFSPIDITCTMYTIMSMDYDARKSAAKVFMEHLAQSEEGLLWLHNNLHPNIQDFIISNSEQGCTDRMLAADWGRAQFIVNWIKAKFFGPSGKFGQTLGVIKMGISCMFMNLDLFLDCGLVVLLVTLYSDSVQDQLYFIVLGVMTALIFIPMFFNYCTSSAKKSTKKKWLRFCNLPLFPIVSQASTIGHMHQKAILQHQVDSLTMSSNSSSDLVTTIFENSNALLEKVEKLEEVKSEILKRRLLETSSEGQPQSYIKILLLLLTISQTPNAQTFGTIFGKNINVFGMPSKLVLTFFILSPILKNALFYLKTLDKKKTTAGSIVLILFIFFCLLGKLVSIITVFSPPLGLFSILGHWKEEQTPFSCTVMSPPEGDGFYYGALDGKVTKRSWTEIGGTICIDEIGHYVNIESGNFTKWKPKDASSYFPLDLVATCTYVTIVAIVRLLAVYIAKILLSPAFKTSSLARRLSHIFYQSTGAVPLTFSSWEDANNLPDIWLMYSQENREMMALLTINVCENILLLVPMMATFYYIADRHSTLQSTIGNSQQEEKSYTNALMLLVGSMVAVLGSFFLEIILFLSYYRYAHLKKALLTQTRLLANEKVLTIITN